ncbi:MAG: MFS transporter, partial [Hydrococcus sp. CRU_1_1]|nr:MFS transporter [Hydrococcus sp. CRU_1_1]
MQLISERSDLSKRDAKRIAAKLESVWQKTIEQRKTSNNNPLEELANYLSSATKEQLVGKDSNSKLDELTQEIRKRRQTQTTNPLAQATTMSLNSLIGLVLGRTDLSDFDIDTIIDRLQSLREDFGTQTDKLATQIGNQRSFAPKYGAPRTSNIICLMPIPGNSNKISRLRFRNLLYDS